MIVVRFNPDNVDNADRLAAFRNHYGIGEEVRILGGYGQQLSGDGERVTLLSPDLSQIGQPFELPRVQEDEVVYDNQLPWPTQADNTGKSLTRLSADHFGNDPTSWIAADPTPGSFGDLVGDFNGDGKVDTVDINLFLEAARSPNPDAVYDINGDGLVNNDDRDMLIEDIIGTSYGDSNLDGVFDSGDLVAVFTVGEYEDAIDGNSTWEDGDWNGDGDFGSGDLVLAFAKGGYTAAVPQFAPEVHQQDNTLRANHLRARGGPSPGR